MEHHLKYLSARQDQTGEEHKILLYADNVMVSNRSEKHFCWLLIKEIVQHGAVSVYKEKKAVTVKEKAVHWSTHRLNIWNKLWHKMHKYQNSSLFIWT